MSLFLLSLFIPTAHASNLCGLTQADVDDVIDYYNMTTSYQAVSPYIAAPFNCSLYGDLCEDMGAARAQAWVCNRWADLLDHVYPSTVAVNAFGDLEAKSTAYVVATYPNGIPDNATYWSRSSGSGCARKEVATSGNARVVTRSFYTYTGVFEAIGGNVEAFYWAATSWKRNNSASVSVANLLASGGTSGVCDGSDSASDTDGFVSKYEWYVGFGTSVGLFESVESDGHSGSVAPNTTCRTAPWDDAACH